MKTTQKRRKKLTNLQFLWTREALLYKDFGCDVIDTEVSVYIHPLVSMQFF